MDANLFYGDLNLVLSPRTSRLTRLQRNTMRETSYSSQKGNEKKFPRTCTHLYCDNFDLKCTCIGDVFM